MVYAIIYIVLGILTVEMIDYLAFGKIREALTAAGKDIYKKDGITIDEGEHFKAELMVKFVFFLVWPCFALLLMIAIPAYGSPKKMKQAINDIKLDKP